MTPIERLPADGARDDAELASRESGSYVAADIHRLLVETVQDYAIFVLDRDGRILTWNPGAERLKGYVAHEILGKHFSIFYGPEEVERGHPTYELAVAEAQGRYEEEGWRLRKGGSSFWASVTITALRDPDGGLIGFAKVTRDLTERRAAELKAIEDGRDVARLNRAKSEFLAEMSHDLRTPLNAIAGYLDLLAHGVYGELTDAQVTSLQRIRASQQHLLTLINDLLRFGSIESGRMIYERVPFVLSDVIAETVGPMIEPMAIDNGISVEWQEPDPAAIAVADRTRVEQILLNLISNAVRYTERGGHVHVRHALRGDRAVVEVTDTGMGIPAEYVEAIFEPFVQVDRQGGARHGTGLGLAISYHLAQAMGGELTVRSTVGEGSTFTLALPTEG